MLRVQNERVMLGRQALRAALVLSGLACLGATAALAQDPAATTNPAAAQKPAAVKPAAKAPGAAATAPADGSLRTRVEQLEEQLVDMQVMVGTLESLAKSPQIAGAVSMSPRASGGVADAGRIEALETQIRALTAQVEQLSAQVKNSGGNGGGFAAPRMETLQPPVVAAPAAGTGTWGTSSPDGPSGTLPPVTDRVGSSSLNSASGDPGAGKFGGPSSGDAIGGFIEREQVGPAAPLTPQAPPQNVAAVDPVPAASSGDAKQLYETAYGYLLQQDYGAAQASFSDFLQKYPNDSLAGNAQYWLGESHYVKGEYKAAAGAFLKGYQTYVKSAKAPDSLLKLAMSLDKLGQKDAACSSYGELAVKFPAAPPHVKNRAQSERARVGCP